MPRSLDATSTTRHALATDQDKPPDRRPTFELRELTGKQMRAVAAVYDSVDEASTAGEAVDGLFSALRQVVAGWRHMATPEGDELPFDPDRLEELLTPAEAFELLGAAMNASMLGPADRKKFESPSPTGRAASAEAPAPQDATAAR